MSTKPSNGPALGFPLLHPGFLRSRENCQISKQRGRTRCRPKNPPLAKFRKTFHPVPRGLQMSHLGLKYFLEGAFSKTEITDLRAILTGMSAHIEPSNHMGLFGFFFFLHLHLMGRGLSAWRHLPEGCSYCGASQVAGGLPQAGLRKWLTPTLEMGSCCRWAVGGGRMGCRQAPETPHP